MAQNQQDEEATPADSKAPVEDDSEAAETPEAATAGEEKAETPAATEDEVEKDNA